jgi:hypothetical protein
MLRHRDRDGVRMPVSAQRTAAAPDAEAIWRELHDGLLGFIERRVRSRQNAEDILQEVMVRICRADLHLHDAILTRPDFGCQGLGWPGRQKEESAARRRTTRPSASERSIRRIDSPR